MQNAGYAVKGLIMGDSKFKAFWDFIFLSSGEMIGKIAGLLAFAYLARVLNPMAYGSVEVALALLGILTLFVEFGFGAIGAREISHRKSGVNEYASTIPGMKLLLALVCIPLMWSAAFVMAESDQAFKLIFITAFALLATVWNQRWLFQGLEKMALVSFNQALRMLFFAVCVVLFVRSADDLIRVGIIEVSAAAIMALYFLYLQYRESIPIRISLNVKKSRALIEMAFPVGASNMLWALNQYLPTLTVAYFMGGLATAWLGAAHRIENAIISFSMVYHFNLFPAVTRRLTESDQAFNEIVRPSVRVTAWGGISIAVVISLLSAHVCMVVFGKEFAQAATTLAVLIWSLPLTLLNGHARWALIAINKQRYVLYAQSSGTLTTVIACLLLIPSFGPVGGAVAMVCCSLVVWIVAHVNATRRIAPIPSLNLVWRPALLAVTTIAAVAYYANDSLPGILLGIAGFFLIAPVMDRSLLADIHKISSIKNVQEGEQSN